MQQMINESVDKSLDEALDREKAVADKLNKLDSAQHKIELN